MRKALVVLAMTAMALSGGLALAGRPNEKADDRIRLELSALPAPAYDHQRVVYQENEGGGWFNHGFLGLVGSLENHVAAVGVGNIDIRVILQGKGLDLLRNPDAAMRGRIDRLRAEGVRFIVCRNSLIQSGTSPSDLYGVKATDIARAGVAEIAMLEAKGFVYLRP